jgi:sec-independent protein translocase protein TatC
MEDFKKQMLAEHLTDLRSCLIYSLIASGVGFALSYAFIKPIGNWFFHPLYKVMPDQTNLIFISYQEAFFFI